MHVVPDHCVIQPKHSTGTCDKGDSTKIYLRNFKLGQLPGRRVGGIYDRLR